MQIQALLTRLKATPPPADLVDLYRGSGSDIDAQIERARSLVARVQEVFPAQKEISLFSSPGRTEVGGNHTDHNAGRVLAAAVNLDIMAAAGPTDNNRIVIDSQGYRPIVVNLSHLNPDANEKGSSAGLVRGICSRLKELGYAIGGFNACFTSNVPNGSGLSSSAAFEMMVATILSELYNDGKITPILAAQVGQYAENNYFGKPSGLMDQTTSAVGGFVTIDFRDAAHPVVRRVNFDFASTGYALAIIGTGGSHADLTDDYASIANEMKSVARALGGSVLRDVSLEILLPSIKSLRGKVSDRAILRAMHFYADDTRVVDEVTALERGKFDEFLRLVIESGNSSWKLLQNIYSIKDVHEQGIAIALALSEKILQGRGAWRVHGGGFAGTIQAFVPHDLVGEYQARMSSIFGAQNCHLVSIRSRGATKIRVEA